MMLLQVTSIFLARKFVIQIKPAPFINYKIVDILGYLLFERNVNYTSEIKDLINLNNISSNMVFLIISEGDKVIDVRRVINEK